MSAFYFCFVVFVRRSFFSSPGGEVTEQRIWISRRQESAFSGNERRGDALRITYYIIRYALPEHILYIQEFPVVCVCLHLHLHFHIDNDYFVGFAHMTFRVSFHCRLVDEGSACFWNALT